MENFIKILENIFKFCFNIAFWIFMKFEKYYFHKKYIYNIKKYIFYKLSLY